MKILPIRRHRSWSELASAAADGTIDPSQREAFARHLEGCSRCQAAVAELGGLRAALRHLPEMETPRSFRLTPAMLAASDPLETRRPSRTLRAANFGARLAAGVAAVALAAVFVVDFGFRDGGADQASRLASEDGAGTTEIAIAAAEATPPGAEATDTSSGAMAPDSEPAPEGTPTASEKVGPENRQTRDDAGTAETTFGFAGAEPGEDSDEWLLRGLEIGLAAALAAAVIAAIALRRQARRAG